jgi:AraC-like DNA-binding protein
MAGDVLSDLLKTVRLTGAAFFEIAAEAPWAVASPPREAILPRVLPGADHLIAYHVVTVGRCVANIAGSAPIELHAGEVIVFTQGDPHVMSSGAGMRADPPTTDVLDIAAAAQAPFLLNYGNADAVSAKLVCGYLACDAQPFNPLIEALPRVVKAGDLNGGDPGWLSQFIRFAVAETVQKREGGETFLNKLSELMFIDVVRRYIATLPAEKSGWLAGLRDPMVGKALTLIHNKPAHDWTIKSLARQAGLSRSVLAERFTAVVGIPPMYYLAKWRMQIAAELLSSGNSNLVSIATRIGYDSESAFSRAFKKMLGVPPSAWRRGVRP